MKFFRLLREDKIVTTSDKKVIPESEFSQLVDAAEIKKALKAEHQGILEELEAKRVELDQSGEDKGFQRGLEQWNEQLGQLEKEIKSVRDEMTKTIVPLAMTALKKLIGRELEEKPETIVDLVKTSLKSVASHRKVKIYVNKSDLDLIEEKKGDLKSIFENIEAFAIAPRDDVEAGGCIIETEAGIINANLERQLAALEVAFKEFFAGGTS